MKAIVLIGAFSLLPFVMFSQKGNGTKETGGKKNKHRKESFVYVKSFYDPPKLVYITKKHKAPPSWAPESGYHHRNIYFPSYRIYYDTFDGVYIYKVDTRWVKTFSPPESMKNVDWVSAKKVELDMEGEQPQVYFDQHLTLYPPNP